LIRCRYARSLYLISDPRCSDRGVRRRSGVWMRLRRAGVGAYGGGGGEGPCAAGVPPGGPSLSSRNVLSSSVTAVRRRLLGKGLRGLDGAHRRPLCRGARVQHRFVPDAAGRAPRPRPARPVSTLRPAAQCGAGGPGKAVGTTAVQARGEATIVAAPRALRILGTCFSQTGTSGPRSTRAGS